LATAKPTLAIVPLGSRGLIGSELPGDRLGSAKTRRSRSGNHRREAAVRSLRYSIAYVLHFIVAAHSGHDGQLIR